MHSHNHLQHLQTHIALSMSDILSCDGKLRNVRVCKKIISYTQDNVFHLILSLLRLREIRRDMMTTDDEPFFVYIIIHFLVSDRAIGVYVSGRI